MPHTGGFRLTKFYLDCVTPSGAAYIAYAARLHWGRVRVGYAALLASDPEGRAWERHTFSGVTEPRLAGGVIRWECLPVGVAGVWAPSAPAQQARLLDAGRSRIDWEGVAPRAACELRLQDGGLVRGTGYVERLELTVLPWQLPFDTLHWGRYHARDMVLFWIAWDGETRLRHIRLDGKALADARFAPDAISFDTAEAGGDVVVLQLLQTRTLRRAPIVTALESLPPLLQRVPSGFHRAEEEKWLSRACSSVGERTSHGWALHERVRLR